MYVVKYPVALAAVFVWVGMICAISFLEAWLKFRSPGITLSLGLGIGKLVFNALLKIEWILAAAVIVNLFLGGYHWNQTFSLLMFIPVLLLLIQTFWLLPALDARADLYINQQMPPKSFLHYYYVFFELAKLICLITAGVKFLKSGPF